MQYNKQALSFPEQADQLLDRGLIADRDTLISRLAVVNYYRLSAYWHPFRDLNSKNNDLVAGTTLEAIWERYVFDRQLRLLVIDAIERIEIAIRTQLCNNHVLKHGPFGYLSSRYLPGISQEKHYQLVSRIKKEAKISSETFVKHYREKYDYPEKLPLWMACELMTFGNLLSFFSGIEQVERKSLATCFNIHAPIMISWLMVLNQVRNICAHHARLWNREFGIEARIPKEKHDKEWHQPLKVTGKKMFGVLTILQYLLEHIAPQSNWHKRLINLFAKYPEVPIAAMGFPSNWQECSIWSRVIK